MSLGFIIIIVVVAVNNMIIFVIITTNQTNLPILAVLRRTATTDVLAEERE